MTKGSQHSAPSSAHKCRPDMDLHSGLGTMLHVKGSLRNWVPTAASAERCSVTAFVIVR